LIVEKLNSNPLNNRQDIGVAIVTAGPGMFHLPFILTCFSIFKGITNSITAMKNAQMAESPVLLLGGASPTLLRGRGALQV
jgi:thiamine pyrophosphate-dependent acetolactate synthase large subunit-like protein